MRNPNAGRVKFNPVVLGGRTCILATACSFAPTSSGVASNKEDTLPKKVVGAEIYVNAGKEKSLRFLLRDRTIQRLG